MENRLVLSRDGIRWSRLATVVVSLAVSVLAIPAQASLFVSLVQVPPVPTEYEVGVPESLQMQLKVTGSLDAPLSVIGLSVVMTWSPPAGYGPTTLQTVDINGNPSTSGAATTIVSGPGYFFNGKNPTVDMVAGPTDPDTQRFLGFNADSTLIAAGNVDLTIALIRFAVGPLGATDEPLQYTFVMDGSDEALSLGLLKDDFSTVPLANGGGTILAVPEPTSIAMLMPGIFVVGGIVLRHGVRRRPAACIVG